MADEVFQAIDFSQVGFDVTRLQVFTYPCRDDQSRGKVHLCFTRTNEHGQFYEVSADTWNEIRKITVTPDTNTDELINEYAAKMQAVYYSGSAGNHTFTGLMAEFARKLLGKD